MSRTVRAAAARTAAQLAALAESTSVEQWNHEDEADLEVRASPGADIVVFSRDWTVETVVGQIKQGNIDLDPDFQRRNAWKDSRRSRLVESLILNFPVPQVVLAENPTRARSYLVIDGKQRLMTIAGFFLPSHREYWDEPRFTGLDVLSDLNGRALDEFISAGQYSGHLRQLQNASIRTTVVSGFGSEDVLYNIFYRLNTGSVALSSQELRQVLNRGGFSKQLLVMTAQDNPVRTALGLDEPDARLRDVELMLRLVAWRLRGSEYVGNMKPFLDYTMRELNREWDNTRSRAKILDCIDECFSAVSVAIDVFGGRVGRRYKSGRYESQLNRAVFEVQALWLSGLSPTNKQRQLIVSGYERLCENPEFVGTIESTTKSIDNYRRRFGMFGEMLRDVMRRRVREPIAVGR